MISDELSKIKLWVLIKLRNQVKNIILDAAEAMPIQTDQTE